MRAARPEARRAPAALPALLLLAACGTDVVRLESTVSAPPLKPECVAIPLSKDFLCAYCGTDYTVQRACLKCTPPAEGMTCSDCTWSDLKEMHCKACPDTSGVVSTAACTDLRQDLKVPGS